jgi:quercetin 2,3-dioxygenase
MAGGRKMIAIRRSSERGHLNHGWLDTYHTFSFGDYYDPRNMGFRSIRVINEDRVEAGHGFPTHPHRDMEIITYVLEGGLTHRDSMGNSSIINPGDGQRMTAGTGIRHSEANASDSNPVHLLQIWILPERDGLEPGYEQKSFPVEEKKGKLRVIAAKGGEQGAVHINQDAKLFVSVLDTGNEVKHAFQAGRYGWLQVAKGKVELNGKKLSQGDGAAIADETEITIKAGEDAEVLLFDVA